MTPTTEKWDIDFFLQFISVSRNNDHDDDKRHVDAHLNANVFSHNRTRPNVLSILMFTLHYLYYWDYRFEDTRKEHMWKIYKNKWERSQ